MPPVLKQKCSVCPGACDGIPGLLPGEFAGCQQPASMDPAIDESHDKGMFVRGVTSFSGLAACSSKVSSADSKWKGGMDGWMVPGNETFCVPSGTESGTLEIAGSTLPINPSKANEEDHGGKYPTLVIPSVDRQGSGILPFLHVYWRITSPGVNWRALNEKF